MGGGQYEYMLAGAVSMSTCHRGWLILKTMSLHETPFPPPQTLVFGQMNQVLSRHVSLPSLLRYLDQIEDLEATDTEDTQLNYGIVVDCGSSGSRVFVYFWPPHNGNPHDLLDIKQMRDRSSKPVVKKIKPGTLLRGIGLSVLLVGIIEPRQRYRLDSAACRDH